MPQKSTMNKTNKANGRQQNSSQQEPSQALGDFKESNSKRLEQREEKSIHKERNLRKPAMTNHKITEDQFIINENLEEVSLRSTIQFFVRHSIREIGRRKFHYSLAFFSVFLVVLATLVINTVLEKGPIIFLRLAEWHHGEIDGYVFPSGEYEKVEYSNGLFLNYTRLLELYGTTYNLSPRKSMNAVLIALDYDKGFYSSPAQKQKWHKTFDKKLNLPQAEDVYSEQYPASKSFSSRVLAFKTQREREMEVGKQYQEDPLKPGECLLSVDETNKFSRAYQVDDIDVANSQNHIAFLTVVGTHLISTIAEKYNKERAKPNNLQEIPIQKDFFEIKMPCRVRYVDKFTGKTSPHWGHNVVLEYDHLLESFSYFLPEPYNKDEYSKFREYLRTPYLLDQFADQFIVTLPKPRVQIFESPSIEIIRGRMSSYFRQIEEALGFFPIYLRSEFLFDIANYSRFVLFIGLIFDLVVLILMIISMLLIYSLLMINIETKSFEIGVERMLGLSKAGLISIVLVQSFLFVVPALIAGFTMSIPCLWILSKILFQFLRLDLSVIPCDHSMYQAFVIGTIIPAFSAILPIKATLSKSLNDALDIQRSKTQAVYHEVLQIGRRNIKEILTFGIFASCYGISVYYLLPYALLSFNLTFILRMFVFILFNMLFALTLIAMNTQRILEIAFTNLFLFFEQSSIKILVLKNLMANRQRNKLTTIIYSLGLGFIIFMNITYKVQILTLNKHELRFRAGYLQLAIRNYEDALDPKSFEPILESNEMQGIIQSYTWIPMELANIKNLKGKKSLISDYSRNGQSQVGIYGIQPNIFETTHTELFQIDHQDRKSALSIVEQLYTARGSQSLGVGSIITEKAAIDLNNYQETLVLDIHTQWNNRMYLMRPLFTASMVPGFTMTDMELTIFNKQSILMSLPIYASLGQLRISEIPMERLVIRLKDYKNKSHIKYIAKKIIEHIDLQFKFQDKYEISDYFEQQSQLNEVDFLLEAIFYCVVPTTMFLCFFSLSASMSANLYEQSKEVGILRAVGFKSKKIAKLYIYEAFILVVSSSILGVFIGTFIGLIMILQQGMFLQLPLPFLFPLKQILQIVCFSMLCAFLSTYGPVWNLLKQPIAKIFRA